MQNFNVGDAGRVHHVLMVAVCAVTSVGNFSSPSSDFALDCGHDAVSSDGHVL